MGDAGSAVLLGLLSGCWPWSPWHQSEISVWSWLLLLGVFIADTAVTLVNRVARGEKWYEGHSQHAYQILSRRLQSHSRGLFWDPRYCRCALAVPRLATGILPHYGVLFATIGLLPLFVACHLLGAGIDNAAGGAKRSK